MPLQAIAMCKPMRIFVDQMSWQRSACSYKDSAEYANAEKSHSACLHKHRMEC